MHFIEIKLVAVAVAGILSQWLAWRFKIPAIALLLACGFVVGPVTGFIIPAEDFGSIYKPVITVAVAIILFEGGLTLNFREIRETSQGVFRLVILGAPLVWLLTAASAYYIGGLSLPVSAVLGAILIVTGPTVIMPLLRQARLQPRVASLLRWESIVNDPFGALLAVISFEVFLIYNSAHSTTDFLPSLLLALLMAVPGAWLLGKGLVWAFSSGQVPEFLKVPVTLGVVILSSALTNIVFEEAGLLTVTVLGITLANSRFAGFEDMRRFKETVTTILVSSVFILLAASIKLEAFTELGMPALIFTLMVLFVIRPIALGIATIGAGLTWQERAMTALIAPRGIVAVAIAGLFATKLSEQGIADGDKILAFTIIVVAATIVVHGFGISYLAKVLNLRSTSKPGILLVGGNPFSIKLAETLKEAEIPVMLTDENWSNIAEAKRKGIDIYNGDVLSEHGHHHINPGDWSKLIATTRNEAYNALVCSEFGPEIGTENVYEAGRQNDSLRSDISYSVGGRPFPNENHSIDELIAKARSGSTFWFETFDKDTELQRDDGFAVLWIDDGGHISIFNGEDADDIAREDQVLFFGKKKPKTAE